MLLGINNLLSNLVLYMKDETNSDNHKDLRKKLNECDKNFQNKLYELKYKK